MFVDCFEGYFYVCDFAVNVFTLSWYFGCDECVKEAFVFYLHDVFCLPMAMSTKYVHSSPSVLNFECYAALRGLVNKGFNGKNDLLIGNAVAKVLVSLKIMYYSQPRTLWKKTIGDWFTNICKRL